MGLAPDYAKTWSKCSLRSFCGALVKIFRSRMKTKGNQAFATWAPLLWSDVLEEIRQVISLSSFRYLKLNLKIILKIYYYYCYILFIILLDSLMLCCFCSTSNVYDKNNLYYYYWQLISDRLNKGNALTPAC